MRLGLGALQGTHVSYRTCAFRVRAADWNAALMTGMVFVWFHSKTLEYDPFSVKE